MLLPKLIMPIAVIVLKPCAWSEAILHRHKRPVGERKSYPLKEGFIDLVHSNRRHMHATMQPNFLFHVVANISHTMIILVRG